MSEDDPHDGERADAVQAGDHAGALAEREQLLGIAVQRATAQQRAQLLALWKRYGTGFSWSKLRKQIEDAPI